MVKCSPRKLVALSEASLSRPDGSVVYSKPFAPVLPLEIILHIFEYLGPYGSDLQPALNKLSLVCRSWYAAFVCSLYNSPHVKGSRFHRFVDVLCAPVNAKSQRSGLAEHVHVLDLAALVDEGGGSPTAKLFRTVRMSLERFVAPKAVLS